MSIVPDEITRLYMVNESEKLLSKLTGSEKFYVVRMAIKIWRYDGVNDYGKRTLIYENDGFSISLFQRWKWFFRYRQAIEQVKTPKQLVQIESISYAPINADEIRLKVLRNKLIAAKADVTKVSNSIKNGIKIYSETSLFSYEQDPEYKKAIDYLNKKEQLVLQIETEIHQLQQNATT